MEGNKKSSNREEKYEGREGRRRSRGGRRRVVVLSSIYVLSKFMVSILPTCDAFLMKNV